MWVEFLFDSLYSALFLFAPGYVFFRLIGVQRIFSFGFAPLSGLFFLAIVAFVSATATIPMSSMTLLLTTVAVLFFTALALRLGVKRKLTGFHADAPCFKSILLTVGVSLIVGLFYFVLPLDGAASFFQENDNVAHLAAVKKYMDSGLFADGGSFVSSYPSLWRTYTAMIAGLGSGSVTIAANAVNFVITVLLFPLSSLFFIISFIRDSRILRLAPLLPLSFVVFPWGFEYFGPLYPNLLGYALLPLVMSLVVYACNSVDIKRFLVWASAFLIACVVLLRAHPSAIFVGIVVMTPYIAFRVNDMQIELGTSIFKRRLILVVFFLFIAALWMLFYSSPMFQGVVSFDWRPYISTPQAVANVALLGLTKSSATQLLLALLVLLGCLCCVLKRRWCWLVCSHLLIGAIYVACTSFPPYLQHLFSGFWYNDSFRVAAMFVFTGYPLACIGLATANRLVASIVNAVSACQADRTYIEKTLSLILPAIVVAIVFYPSFTFAQNVYWTTGFGKAAEMLHSGYSLAENKNALDGKEWEFLKKVKREVGQQKVLNYPYDGSAYAKTLADINVLNQGWFGYDLAVGSDRTSRQILCESIDRISLDIKTAEAARSEGVEFLLLLDIGAPSTGGCYYTAGYSEEYWKGIESVDDATPGLSLVLSQDDMRLYKID